MITPTNQSTTTMHFINTTTTTNNTFFSNLTAQLLQQQQRYNFTKEEIAYTHYYPALLINRYVTPIWYLVGIFGNILSAIVWLQPYMRRNSSSAVYLACLSINDTFVLMLHPIYELTYIWFVSLVDYPILCETYAVLFLAAQYMAPFLALCFTVDRYIAICYPFKKQKYCTVKRAIQVVMGMVSLSLSLCFIQAYFWTYDYKTEKCMVRANVLDPLWTRWTSCTESIVFLLVPLLNLIINLRVIREIYRLSSSSPEQLQQQLQQQHSRLSVSMSGVRSQSQQLLPQQQQQHQQLRQQHSHQQHPPQHKLLLHQQQRKQSFSKTCRPIYKNLSGKNNDNHNDDSHNNHNSNHNNNSSSKQKNDNVVVILNQSDNGNIYRNSQNTLSVNNFSTTNNNNNINDDDNNNNNDVTINSSNNTNNNNNNNSNLNKSMTELKRNSKWSLSSIKRSADNINYNNLSNLNNKFTNNNINSASSFSLKRLSSSVSRCSRTHDHQHNHTKSHANVGSAAATNVMLLSVSFYVIFTTLPPAILYSLENYFEEGPSLNTTHQEIVENHQWQRYIVYYYFQTVAYEIALSHYACNLILFSLTGRKFRSALCRTLHCGKQQQQQQQLEQLQMMGGADFRSSSFREQEHNNNNNNNNYNYSNNNINNNGSREFSCNHTRSSSRTAI